jgi:hypothetical protein
MGMTRGNKGTTSAQQVDPSINRTVAVGAAPQNDFYDYRTGQSFEKEA